MEETGGDIDGVDEKKRKKAAIIQIPSYQEVFGTADSSAPRPHNPYPTFSQAFSFIKSSEFYTPPPPAPPPPTPPPPASGEPPPPPLPSDSSCSASSSYSAATGSGQNRNAILVSLRQKGNPLLKHIRNVRWTFADVVCDYLLGQSSCALYISLRYHLLHPDYLYYRIKELQKNYTLRVVLCHVDVEDVVKPLLEVTRTAMLHDCTLLCGWRYHQVLSAEKLGKVTGEAIEHVLAYIVPSVRDNKVFTAFAITQDLSLCFEECGRYLETLKVYENKPSDSIREQTHIDYLSRLNHALTSIRHVNKTDVVTLGSAFGSLSGIMDASMEDLARCPGIGERKVKRLHDTFHEPFRRVSSRHTTVAPQTSVEDKNAGETSTSTNNAAELDQQRPEDPDPKPKKDSNVNVRSALNVAFAKYAERVRKRDAKGTLPGQGKESSGKTAKDGED